MTQTRAMTAAEVEALERAACTMDEMIAGLEQQDDLLDHYSRGYRGGLAVSRDLMRAWAGAAKWPHGPDDYGVELPDYLLPKP